MPRFHAQGFNKEKLLMLASSGIFAGGVYFFVASEPVLIEPGEPISGTQAPPALSVPSLSLHDNVNFYIVPGTNSHLLDPRTGQPVNRDRKNPFAPEAGFRTGKPKAASGIGAAPPAAPPRFEDPKKKEKEDPKKNPWETGRDHLAKVGFMGVIVFNGETYGLVQPKDGGAAKRVKIGDVITADGDKYTVTSVEKQAILLSDDKGNPFVLRDTDTPVAADDADADDAKPAKDDKKADQAKDQKPDDKAAKPAKDAKPKPADQTPPKRPEHKRWRPGGQ